MHEEKELNGDERKKEGMEAKGVGNTEEVRIIKIVTPREEPGFRRFYQVADDDSKEERALSEVELLEIYDQLANKIQDYRQFGPNEAEHPHTMADYKQLEKARLEKMKSDEAIGEAYGFNLVED